MSTHSERVGGAAVDATHPVIGEDLSGGGLLGLGERALCALPVQISALLIIVFSLIVMALGGLVEFVVISQLV